MSEPVPGADRLPRSLHESASYDPAWRHRQVLQYLHDCRHFTGPGPFVLPAEEHDRLVRACYKFRRGEVGSRDSLLRYACECERTNERQKTASRINAWTTAGLSTREIAQRLHTGEDQIETYQRLFFDVEDYVNDPSALAIIVEPRLHPGSGVDRSEQRWLLAALRFGRNGVDAVMGLRGVMTPEDLRQLEEQIHSFFSEQALNYLLSLELEGDPGDDILVQYQKFENSRVRYPGPDPADAEARNEGLLKLIYERRKERLAKEEAQRKPWEAVGLQNDGLAGESVPLPGSNAEGLPPSDGALPDPLGDGECRPPVEPGLEPRGDGTGEFSSGAPGEENNG
jgi:hypothetical protein